jgi:excisionase family DNA binding protein
VTPIALPIKGCAQAASLSERTIWKAVSSGQLPSITVGRSRRVLVSDLEAWLRQGRGQTAPGHLMPGQRDLFGREAGAQ